MSFFNRICLILIFVGLTQSVFAQKKIALIIGIGNYKYWDKISSDNDVPYVRSALLRQGFAENNISILLDEKATMAGLNNAFKQLIKKVSKGDIVFIHVSSHGEQIEDNKNDEVDGLDESIVSYDAPKPGSTSNYAKEQSYYFRDDQFGVYVNLLRSKLGKEGDLVVFLDACHSGSGIRGIHKVRGNQAPLVSTTFKKPLVPTLAKAEVFEEAGKPVNSSNLASYILVSGSLAEERNTESTYPNGKEGGSLSIALTRELENLKPGTTYRSLFSDILVDLNEMVPDQHPVIEGDGLDRELFGGKFVSQKPYLEIEEIYQDTLIVKGGTLMGVDSGAKVSLYQSGTRQPENANTLATGTIIAAESFRSLVKLDKIPDLRSSAAGWVFITEPVFKFKELKIGFENSPSGSIPSFSNTEIEKYKNIISTIPNIQLATPPDLIITKGSENDSIRIASNGYVFSSFTAGDGAEFRRQLDRYSQYLFLQQAEIKSSQINMEVKLVPLINGKAEMKAVKSQTKNGVLEFKVGDGMVIYARNNGDYPVYLNILDMQPDGIINPIFPNTSTTPRITPEELKIEPGQEKTFSNFVITIGKPTGLEVFKIFMSLSKIDMERISNRTISAKGDLTMLEKLVDQSFEIASKGSVNPGNPEGAVLNLPFRIVDRK